MTKAFRKKINLNLQYKNVIKPKYCMGVYFMVDEGSMIEILGEPIECNCFLNLVYMFFKTYKYFKNT